MGYSYGFNPATGRMNLSCDSCGTITNVRKRTCPYCVRYHDGTSLPYCPAPALCGPCFTKRGKNAGVHEACKEGARQAQARENVITARLSLGEHRLAAGFGSWHETVPEGSVGAIFRNKQGEEVYRLIPVELYQNRPPDAFLEDFTESADWPEHP